MVTDKEKELNELFDKWESIHRKNGYERFIQDGIVSPKTWETQTTPKVCFFLKEAYTKQDKYNLVNDLHNNNPWTMWRKVAIWTQAIHNAFYGMVEYNDSVIRENEKQAIECISVVNIKKSNGQKHSDYEDLKKYAEEDNVMLKQELEIINPDIILCGNNISLLKLVLGEELQNEDTWDNMIAKWKNTLVIDYYHPAVQYPNRVNYYALTSICHTAIKKYGLNY